MNRGEREARLPPAEQPVEGRVRLVEIDGHRIGVFRVAGELYALADRCPHRGAPLCAGSIVTTIEVRGGEVALGPANATLRCPWHKWEFDITTGRSLVDPKLRVRRYAVRIDGDEAVVSLDAAS